jgi:hypothetical protein
MDFETRAENVRAPRDAEARTISTKELSALR